MRFLGETESARSLQSSPVQKLSKCPASTDLSSPHCFCRNLGFCTSILALLLQQWMHNSTLVKVCCSAAFGCCHMCFNMGTMLCSGVFGDTCLFVALFVPHMWHHPLPALRQIKAFFLRFVKSTNQCLFSPFVLICEWDIIPNFADMSGETRRGHLCRIEPENYRKSENPDSAPQKSPDARFASESKIMLCRELWVGFQMGSKHTCFYSECKFYKIAQNEYDPSATAVLSWTYVLFNLTGDDIVRQLIWHT